MAHFRTLGGVCSRPDSVCDLSDLTTGNYKGFALLAQWWESCSLHTRLDTQPGRSYSQELGASHVLTHTWIPSPGACPRRPHYRGPWTRPFPGASAEILCERRRPEDTSPLWLHPLALPLLALPAPLAVRGVTTPSIYPDRSGPSPRCALGEMYLFPVLLLAYATIINKKRLTSYFQLACPKWPPHRLAAQLLILLISKFRVFLIFYSYKQRCRECLCPCAI